MLTPCLMVVGLRGLMTHAAGSCQLIVVVPLGVNSKTRPQSYRDQIQWPEQWDKSITSTADLNSWTSLWKGLRIMDILQKSPLEIINVSAAIHCSYINGFCRSHFMTQRILMKSVWGNSLARWCPPWTNSHGQNFLLLSFSFTSDKQLQNKTTIENCDGSRFWRN